MHAAEREALILRFLAERGFVSFQELDRQLNASPATIRRDLDRLEEAGGIVRVRGGARLSEDLKTEGMASLSGVPFHENVNLHRAAKVAIGREAARLCEPNDSVIIDGGSTTLQMCPHLASLRLHVLTNSLHIVSALLPQAKTQVLLPAGSLFREQNIILSAFEDDGTSRYQASKMFMGAAAVGVRGAMQTDVLLAHAEQRLIARAQQLVLLVDSSKFTGGAGNIVCALDKINTLITDEGVRDSDAQAMERAGVKLIVASVHSTTTSAAKAGL